MDSKIDQSLGSNEIPKELLSAMTAKREVELEYREDGSAAGTRTAQPHALYRGGDGRLLVQAFQTQGPSERGGIPAWRRFTVRSIASIEEIDSSFEVREDYDPSSKDYAAGLIKSVY